MQQNRRLGFKEKIEEDEDEINKINPVSILNDELDNIVVKTTIPEGVKNVPSPMQEQNSDSNLVI